MPPRKRTSSVLNGDTDHEPKDAVEPAAPDDPAALTHALEEAEADAAEAEAALAVARARARALKLRRQAEAAPVDEGDGEVEETPAVAVADDVDDDVEAAPDQPDDEVEADEAGGGRRRPTMLRVRLSRIRASLVAVALIVLVSVGLLVASAWMTFQHRQASALQQQSAELAAAARQGVVTMMSLNFNSAQDDVKRIIDNTTGDFKKDFQGQADEFAKVAQESKVITEATVNATAVQSMTKDGGTVLVAVTTQVSNAASKEQQPRSWRLKVDMVRDGGQLKLAKVEFVP